MSLSISEDSSSFPFQDTTESSPPRTSETLESAELSRPQEKGLGNDEAHTENEANAETVEKPTEEPLVEGQQPETVQVVDLSEENRDEGDHGSAGEENQCAAGEENQGDTGTAPVRVEGIQVEAPNTQQPQTQDNAVARVTLTKHRSKEDLELLKQTDPVSYLNAIIESKSSSDAS